jgi:lipid II:glycine glycyltransferase (peptidoglycan interpeptide bridge formation enzyme)
MITNNITIDSNFADISSSDWETLRNSETSNFFQTPDAISFFEAVGLETFKLVARNEHDVLAVLSGIIQKEKGVKSNFTSRAIIFGGPIFSSEIEDDDIKELLDNLVAQLKSKVIYIEFRNLNDYTPFVKAFKNSGFEYHSHLNFHLNCNDEILMKKRMSSSKLRQVKKSLKEGAQVIEAKNIDQIEAYYKILLHLYKTKVKTPLPSLDFFVTLWLRNTSKFFLIEYNNEIIGGIVAPIFENKAIYEWFVCGKDGMFKNVYPSILATWAAMDFASQNNIPRFDFMGAGKPDEDYGVRDFKSKFGGELVEHGRFCYVTKPFLYEVGKTAVKILKSSK